MIIQCFSMDTTDERKVWAWGEDSRRTYFKEYLPAFFERTLHIDSLGLKGGRLSWIFTGPSARCQIDVKGGKLYARQVFHDSFGLYDVDPYYQAKRRKVRHPERSVKENTVIIIQPIESITVTFDHHLNLTVSVNGEEVVSQHCVFDVTQHQLVLIGTAVSASGTLNAPERRQATVTVNSEETHQTMIGFGGITSPVSYNLLSEEGKELWVELIKEYNLLIQREYPIGGHKLKEDLSNWDNLEDAVPHYYGNNFPNGEITDFSYNKKIQELGGEVWFEFWRYPVWITTKCEGQVNPGKFAAAMVGYCKAAQKKTGKPPAVVGIQNERCQSAESLRAMVSLLRQRLDAAGFTDVKIHMSDAGSMRRGFEFADRFRKYSKVWNTIDFAASHMYDAQSYFKEIDRYDRTMEKWNRKTGGKDFISTELSINSDVYQLRGYRLAFTMAQLYHKNLVITNARAICYCWMLLHTTEPSYQWSRSLFTVGMNDGFVPKPSGFQLRTFGSFSRHIARGMQRVTADSSSPDILCSAYADETGKQTLVILNRGCATYQLDISGLQEHYQYLTCEITDQYRANESSTLPRSDDGYIKIEPGVILTIVTE